MIMRNYPQAEHFGFGFTDLSFACSFCLFFDCDCSYPFTSVLLIISEALFFYLGSWQQDHEDQNEPIKPSNWRLKENLAQSYYDHDAMFSFFRFFHFWTFESYRVCQNQKHDITYSIRNIQKSGIIQWWILECCIYISNILLFIRYISGVLLTCLILWGDHWISMLIHPQMQHSYMIKIPCIHCTYCIKCRNRKIYL